MVDLPADHPARQHQHEVPVPPGVEEDEAEKAAAANEGKERIASLASSSFLAETPPPPLRLPDAAIERASEGLHGGDKRGAYVLRDVFGDPLPWTPKEMFRRSSSSK